MSKVRPTATELQAAVQAMSDMAKAGIFKKAPRAVDGTIACAIAMRTGEFQNDSEAKRRFKIPVTTAVRKLWVPRLEALDVWRKLPARGRKRAYEAYLAQQPQTAASSGLLTSASAEDSSPVAAAAPPPKRCSRATVPGRKRGRPPNSSYMPEVQQLKREKVEQIRQQKLDFPKSKFETVRSWQRRRARDEERVANTHTLTSAPAHTRPRPRARPTSSR